MKQKKTTTKEFFDTHPHTKAIFKKMLEAVGEDIETFDFSPAEWYTTCQWTIEESKKFSGWLLEYLTSNKDAVKEIAENPKRTKTHLTKLVEEFMFMYGWKYVQSNL